MYILRRMVETVAYQQSGVSLATRRRSDLQGLRAVAVILVALNHAGVGFLKGGYVGVDVFFVLSGFLITGVLVSSAEGRDSRPGKFFATFYANRARRILPAAALTLVATDIAASSLLNLERAHQVLVDSVSATFFVANVHFASIGTNYFAIGRPPSPLQHFWSLSVEEQFYVVWPFLVATAFFGVALAHRRKYRLNRETSRDPLRVLGIGALVITLASLAYGFHYTHQNATAAYFSTPARAWELGLGALLSLNVKHARRLSSRLQALIGWAGILAIILASTLYSASTAFPGFAALLPTIGAAAVIAAGVSTKQGTFAPSRILSMGALRYVGDRSYSFYLWHWPVLVIALEHAGHSLSLATKLLLLIGAFALSSATYGLYENPIRRGSRFEGSFALILWPTAIAVVLFVSSIHWSDYTNAVNLAYIPAATETLKEEPNTSVVASTGTARPQSDWRPSSPSAVVAAVAAAHAARRIPSSLSPPALALRQSEFKLPVGCIAEPGQTRDVPCSMGDTSSHKSLVIVGDSHALMWMPDIIKFGQSKGFDVHPIIKYGCTVADWAGPEKTRECVSWYKWAVPRARAMHPALLILATRYDVPPSESEVQFTGPNAVKNVSAFGAAVRSSAQQVAIIGDPPGQEQEPTDCLLSPRSTLKRCSFSETPPQAELTTNMESATKAFGVFLDTTPWFCYQGVCPMVVGHTVTYFDRSHITDDYAEELAPLFVKALARVLAPTTTNQPARD
jgi:peptidoglycan/LPS O-acetylase OafA/YrhL